MFVICTIEVLANFFFSNTDVRGKVLMENNSSYVVDFSKETTEKGFEGDYSRKIVSKSKCVEEK